MDNDTLRLLSPVSNELRDAGKVQKISTLPWAMLQQILSVSNMEYSRKMSSPSITDTMGRNDPKGVPCKNPG
jgi:hypothetical protein